MEVRTGKNWSKEETILALELYWKIPFGKIGEGNKDIIELSKCLGRTPGSVALKLQNLAHLDPMLQAKNIRAMAHGSKMDAMVFNEFYQNLEELTYQAELIRKEFNGTEPVERISESDFSLENLPNGENKEQLVKTRRGQDYFREAVLNLYSRKCCITGLAEPSLLIASHIKPWAECDVKTERTNPQNGLCLNALHDAAFDKGFLTIDQKYRVIVSKRMQCLEMDEKMREWFMSYVGKCINLPNSFLPGKEFIEYHNDVVFLK